jgi:toxin ParE1/3/4
MKEIELTPMATEDLEAIWFYSWREFGEQQADDYIGRLSHAFDLLARHDLGSPRPELGQGYYSLPVEQHILFFIPSDTRITLIRILNHAQDPGRHLLMFA